MEKSTVRKFDVKMNLDEKNPHVELMSKWVKIFQDLENEIRNEKKNAIRLSRAEPNEIHSMVAEERLEYIVIKYLGK